MADYTEILDDELLPDAPIPSILGFRWRDNPIAIAEGAVGAPRIEPRALKAPGILSGAIAGTTWVGFTGLGDIKQIRFDIAWAGTSGSPITQVAFSSDGGSSWGATQTLTSALTNGRGASAFGHIDLETGVTVCAALLVGTSSTTGDGGMTSTLTVPANCNAVRFNSNTAGVAGHVFITPIGGRE